MAYQLIVMAIVSAVSAMYSSEVQRKQNEYNAAVNRNNAILKRQEADLTARRTEVEVRALGREQRTLRRKYLEAAGTNTSMLAAGNVDLASGSALDLLEGNANRFADDMGEIEYQKALTTWEGNRKAQLQEWEADNLDSQASFLEASGGSFGSSLFTGALAGFSTYFGGGGTFGGSSAAAKSPFVTSKNPLGLTSGQGL